MILQAKGVWDIIKNGRFCFLYYQYTDTPRLHELGYGAHSKSCMRSTTQVAHIQYVLCGVNEPNHLGLNVRAMCGVEGWAVPVVQDVVPLPCSRGLPVPQARLGVHHSVPHSHPGH